jgi:hypothetical protein
MSQNFSILENGQSFAVTGASSALAFPTEAGRYSCDVMIYNPGPAAVYVRAGDANVVATSASMVIPAGVKEVFGKATASHLAAMTASGSQTILVYLGEGV